MDPKNPIQEFAAQYEEGDAPGGGILDQPPAAAEALHERIKGVQKRARLLRLKAETRKRMKVKRPANLQEVMERLSEAVAKHPECTAATGVTPKLALQTTAQEVSARSFVVSADRLLQVGNSTSGALCQRLGDSCDKAQAFVAGAENDPSVPVDEKAALQAGFGPAEHIALEQKQREKQQGRRADDKLRPLNEDLQAAQGHAAMLRQVGDYLKQVKGGGAAGTPSAPKSTIKRKPGGPTKGRDPGQGT